MHTKMPLHISVNFAILKFLKSSVYILKLDFLQVTSKGIVLQSGTETALGIVQTITTFSIPVSAEMAPALHAVVYHVTTEGEVLSDSIILPVDAINQKKVSFFFCIFLLYAPAVFKHIFKLYILISFAV